MKPKLKIGILHPGQMGISIAASAKNSGHEVYWVSQGRSQQTSERAHQQDLQDANTLAELCRNCDVILSVCPPHAAEDVARRVAERSFTGSYVDANAISPGRVERIREIINAGGANFVDGSIIGGPAWEPGRTWLYLSGPKAEDAASCFVKGPLETAVIGDSIGKASALKMCFAAYTKGTTALLSAILVTAESLGVRQDLERQWSRNGSDFADKSIQRVRQVTAKAWRFVGEMEEISTTFDEAGLPGEFHQAAADIYRRISHFKNASETPSLEAVLTALIQQKE